MKGRGGVDEARRRKHRRRSRGAWFERAKLSSSSRKFSVFERQRAARVQHAEGFRGVAVTQSSSCNSFAPSRTTDRNRAHLYHSDRNTHYDRDNIIANIMIDRRPNGSGLSHTLWGMTASSWWSTADAASGRRRSSRTSSSTRRVHSCTISVISEGTEPNARAFAEQCADALDDVPPAVDGFVDAFRYLARRVDEPFVVALTSSRISSKKTRPSRRCSRPSSTTSLTGPISHLFCWGRRFR